MSAGVMKLVLITAAGGEIEALLATAARPSRRIASLASRLLGPTRAYYDRVLSRRWGCRVYCTPEFSAWWRARLDRPGAVGRIFLEVYRG